MKIIGLEEQFVTGEVLAAWRSLDPQWQDISSKSAAAGENARNLLDLNGDDAAPAAFKAKSKELAPKYHTELRQTTVES